MTETALRVVLVSGPSGAGRSTAINALEDMGFEAIDNIPLSLIPPLVDGPVPPVRPLALGIDARNRDFSVEGLLELKHLLSQSANIHVDLVYLECAPDVLLRRYSETRRRHPLAPDETPADGIEREQALLEDLRPRADILIDTSTLTVHDLRAEIEKWFSSVTDQSMAVSVHSFSYKRGLPQGLDMVLDCRFLRNPHWQPELRPFTGLDSAVASHVAGDPRHGPFLERTVDLLQLMLPGCKAEGKAHFSVGFGCTGGKHRSVAVAESVAAALEQANWLVSIRHRELERRAATGLALDNRKGDAAS